MKKLIFKMLKHEEMMTNYEAYNAQKLNGQTVWLTFLLAGWSYGSMGKMAKQVFFYLTLGGFGLWTIYRLFTLGEAIKNYNRSLALNCGLTPVDLAKLGLV